MAPKHASELTEEDLKNFDWLTLRKEMDAALPTETFLQKFTRKTQESPLVPLGAAVTTAALCYGLWSFRTGNTQMSQYMMRTRVAAQAFTILAMITGIYAAAVRK